MGISRDLKERARTTREDGVFTLKLDEGVSLAMLVSFAQDMFPGVGTEDIGVWPTGRREDVLRAEDRTRRLFLNAFRPLGVTRP